MYTKNYVYKALIDRNYRVLIAKQCGNHKADFWKASHLWSIIRITISMFARKKLISRLSKRGMQELFIYDLQKFTPHIVSQTKMLRKRNMKDRSCVARFAIDRPSSISLEIRQISIETLEKELIGMRHWFARTQFFLDSRRRDFTILYIVRKFYSDGRTNVANTFCDSYRAIPRPFGNAKIDFPENYVREPAQVLRRTQRHTFAYTYARSNSDEIPH